MEGVKLNIHQLTKTELSTLTGEIIDLKNKAVLNFIEIGKRLNKVKLALPHGEFGTYLKETVKFTSWTANKFMTIAEQMTKEDNIKRLADITELGVEKAYLILESELTEVMDDEVNVIDKKTKQKVKKKVKDLTVKELNTLIQQKKKLAEMEQDKEVAKKINSNPQLITEFGKTTQKDIVDEMKVQVNNAKTRMNRLINDLSELNRTSYKGFNEEAKADILLSVKELRSFLNEKSKELKELYDL